LDNWSAPASAHPPTTIANALRDIQPSASGLRPVPLGPRFHDIPIEDLVGAPQVDLRHGGIDLSPDGGEVAISWDRSGANEICVAPVRGDRIYQLTDAGDRSVSPRWSPDGQWLAFLRDSGGDERFQIWVMRRDGRRLRQVTSAGSADHRDIAWSPDGSRLACVSDSTATRHGVEVVDVASGEHVVLSDFASDDTTPRWSPDGRWLLISRDADLHLIPAAGGAAIRLDTRGGAAGSSVDGRWSPDGRSIAFTTDMRGHNEIALAHLDGMLDEPGGARGRSPRVVVLTNSIHDSTEPVWRPDGRGLVYLQSCEGQVSIRRVFVASHADTPVADLPGVHGSAQVGPDSETLAFAYGSARRPPDVWARLQRAVTPQPLSTSLSPRVDPETLVEPIRVRYPAGATDASALLYVPHAEALRGEGSPPAIVHVRSDPPGPTGGWDPTSQWLAHRGYVVLVLGGSNDPADVVAGGRWLGQQGIADAERVGVIGAGGPGTLDPIAGQPMGGTAETQGSTVEQRVDRMRRTTEWLDQHLGAR